MKLGFLKISLKISMLSMFLALLIPACSDNAPQINTNNSIGIGDSGGTSKRGNIRISIAQLPTDAQIACSNIQLKIKNASTDASILNKSISCNSSYFDVNELPLTSIKVSLELARLNASLVVIEQSITPTAQSQELKFDFMSRLGVNTTSASSSSNTATNTATASICTLTSGNFASETAATGKPLLIKVYMPTCSHCQKAAPILAEIFSTNSDKYRYCELNYDNNAQFFNSYWVNTMKQKEDELYVPLLLLFDKGNRLGFFYAAEKKREDIVSWINSAVGSSLIK